MNAGHCILWIYKKKLKLKAIYDATKVVHNGWETVFPTCCVKLREWPYSNTRFFDDESERISMETSHTWKSYFRQYAMHEELAQWWSA